MKRNICIFLAACIMVSLAACGENGQTAKTTQETDHPEVASAVPEPSVEAEETADSSDVGTGSFKNERLGDGILTGTNMHINQWVFLEL